MLSDAEIKRLSEKIAKAEKRIFRPSNSDAWRNVKRRIITYCYDRTCNRATESHICISCAEKCVMDEKKVAQRFDKLKIVFCSHEEECNITCENGGDLHCLKCKGIPTMDMIRKSILPVVEPAAASSL